MFDLPKRTSGSSQSSLLGFRRKLFTDTARFARSGAAVGQAVKLVLSRKMMFQTVGHRPRTQQRVQLGATRDGKLVSLQHDYVYDRSMLDAITKIAAKLRRSNIACPTCG
jgi:CO/xanthine dehydrogenase Mo-binding subunit